MPRRASADRDASLRERLVETAERLFARHGVDGVSLRQIGIEAGSRNNFAVQYHFGDVAGLVHAIQARRVPEFEARRAALLDALPDFDAATTHQLMQILFRPFYDLDPVAGLCSLAIHNSSFGWTGLGDFAGDMATTNAIMNRLAELNPQLGIETVRNRLKVLTYMVLVSLAGDDAQPSDPAARDDVIAMTAAALQAPLPK